MALDKTEKTVSIRIDNHPQPPKKIVTLYDGKPTRFWITRTHEEALEKATSLAARYEQHGYFINKP